jgi:hypothetical protein
MGAYDAIAIATCKQFCKSLQFGVSMPDIDLPGRQRLSSGFQ